ncbi:MAG: hypothetical protein JXR19_00300 [Bacteroidia bacterium]
MKQYLSYLSIVLLLLIGANESKAQLRLTVEASQFSSNFLFTDSDGERDNNYTAKLTGAYRVGYQVKWNSGIYFRNSIGIRKAGATYEFNGINNDWDLQYVEFQLGLGYMKYMESIGVYIAVSPYYAHLTRGNQRLSGINYNLVNSDNFNVNEIGVTARGGLLIDLSEQLDLNVGVSFLRGFTNLELEDNGQITNSQSMGFDLGLAFKID